MHDQVQAIVTRFGAEIEKTENWGRRKLAYEIGHHKEGTYVLEVINGTGELMKEIDRRLKVVTDRSSATSSCGSTRRSASSSARARAARRSSTAAGSRAGCRPSAGRREAPRQRRSRRWRLRRGGGVSHGDAKEIRKRRRSGPVGRARRERGDRGQGTGPAARRAVPPAQGLQVLRGQDRRHQLQGREAAAAVRARSAARSCRGASRARARCTSASCARPSCGRASSRCCRT